MDEWRKLVRDFPLGLVKALRVVAVYGAIALLGEFAINRWPWMESIAQTPQEIVATAVLSALWMPQVIAAFRRGRSRRADHAA